MRLIIHAGMHRTGTSAVQSTLKQLSNHLLNYDIHLPILNETGNGYPLAYGVNNNDFSILDDILHKAKAHISKDGIVLCSAEDFESLLINRETASKFIRYAQNQHNCSVTWVFSLRDPFEYFESLYNRLHDQNFFQPMIYSKMSMEIIKQGYLTITTHFQKFHFIFDYLYFLRLFKEQLNAQICVIPMNEMHTPFSGAVLLRICCLNNKDIIKLHKTIDESLIRKNKSINEANVEFSYLCNYLSIKPTQEAYNKYQDMFQFLIRRRIEAIAECRDDLKTDFSNRFPEESFSSAIKLTNFRYP